MMDDEKTVETVEEKTPESRPPPPRWPLTKGEAGFYRPVRSGAYVSSGQHVSLLQDALGVPRTGVYDDATEEAVRRFRAGRKSLGLGAVVDRKTWGAIFR